MNNDIIFITGASSDIGIELIKSIKEDCLIIAHYNTSNVELLEISKNIKSRLVTLKADLSSEEEVDNMVKLISTCYGIPTKIVHLAAPKFSFVRFKNLAWESFQNDINISLKSITLILRSFLPLLAKERKGKVVIMISSCVIGVPPKALSQYTTIKYALLGLMKSLASEYGDRNININAVSPSMVETKFLSNINEMLIEASAYNNPLKRNATIKDVVPIINLLLSGESDYINGVNIPITGGSIF